MPTRVRLIDLLSMGWLAVCRNEMDEVEKRSEPGWSRQGREGAVERGLITASRDHARDCSLHGLEESPDVSF